MKKTRFAPMFAMALFATSLAAQGDRDDAIPEQLRRDGREIPLRNWSVPMAEQAEEGGLMTPMAVPSAASHFISLNPCRVADTRGNGFSGDYGPPVLGPSQSRTIIIGGQCGVPASASAVSFNLTVAEMASSGNLKIYPFGGAVANVSSINWTGNTFVIANAAVVPLGSSAAIQVVNESATNTHLIIDVNGYFAEGVVTSLTAGNAISVSAATGSVTVSVPDNGIGAAQLAANSVEASEIAADAVTGSEIGTSAVGTSEIADGAVSAADIGTDAVGTDEIAVDAVTSSEIATGAVESLEIANGAIEGVDIATDAVSGTHISAGAVGNSELASNAVTASKFAALSLRESAGVLIPADSAENGSYTTAAQTVTCLSGEALISWGVRWSPVPVAHEELFVQRATLPGSNPVAVTIVAGNDSGNDYTLVAQALCLATP